MKYKEVRSPRKYTLKPVAFGVLGAEEVVSTGTNIRGRVGGETPPIFSESVQKFYHKRNVGPIKLG